MCDMLVYMYVCMLPCAHVHTGTCACVCRCVWVPFVDIGCLFQMLSPLYVDTASLIHFGAPLFS